MDRMVRWDAERAVLHAVRARRERALEQYRDQNDPQLLDELAEKYGEAEADRAMWLAQAICGHPDYRVNFWALNEDAYKYLSRFG